MGNVTGVHPIDARYTELHTKLVPVDRASELHVLLAEYLRATHGATHSSYRLELVQAFEIEREGEVYESPPSR